MLHLGTAVRERTADRGVNRAHGFHVVRNLVLSIPDLSEPRTGVPSGAVILPPRASFSGFCYIRFCFSGVFVCMLRIMLYLIGGAVSGASPRADLPLSR